MWFVVVVLVFVYAYLLIRLLGNLVPCSVCFLQLVLFASMSASSGCAGEGFFVTELSVELFGIADVEAMVLARRTRFLLRRQDPEYLEIISTAAASPPSPELPPAGLRRSRRVLGLSAEYEDVAVRRRKLR